MASPILYSSPLSGNCYKVRLFAALINVPLNVIDVDLAGAEHKEAWFTALNPWQQVPVFKSGSTVIWDSQAILVYLAELHGQNAWWPQDPVRRAKVVEWLSVSVNEIQHGPADARLVQKFGYPLSHAAAVVASQRTLGVIEHHLTTHKWLAGDEGPTLAECAAYPYLALAPEGGISLDEYPALQAWLRRVEALPGYIPLGG